MAFSRIMLTATGLEDLMKLRRTLVRTGGLLPEIPLTGVRLSSQ